MMAMRYKQFLFFYYFSKVSVYIFCVGLFIFLMKDIWFKFSSKITTTGIRFRLDSSTARPFHCLTMHDFSAFKKKGFYYTNEMIRDNSFTKEEIFGDLSLSMFQNASSMITMRELYSIYFGTCFKGSSGFLFTCVVKSFSLFLKLIHFQSNLLFLIQDWASWMQPRQSLQWQS